MAYVAFGIYFAFITVFVALTFREGPEEKGLAPYGAPKGTQAAPAPKLEEKAVASGKKVSPLRQVARMGITWHFGLFYAVYQLGYMAATQYYVVSMTGNGFDLATAAFSLTIGGVLTIITELIVGSLSDRYERKNIIGIMVACTGVLSAGYAIYLLNTPAPDLIPCYFFIALISASTGVITVIMSGAGEYYNDECRATGTGMIGTINIVGRYLGPWVAGHRDRRDRPDRLRVRHRCHRHDCVLLHRLRDAACGNRPGEVGCEQLVSLFRSIAVRPLSTGWAAIPLARVGAVFGRALSPRHSLRFICVL